MSGFLHFRDGTTYRIDNSSVSWIRDRNGNRLFFTYDPQSHRVTQITDSLNRMTTVTYGTTNCAQSSACDLISYLGWTGESRTIEIGLSDSNTQLLSGAPEPLQELFPEINASPYYSGHSFLFPVPVYSYVRLPDGNSFQILRAIQPVPGQP